MGEQAGPSAALGTQIADARRAKGMTQQQLAEAAGVTRKTVNRWENGHTTGLGANYARLAQALGWPAEQALKMVQGDGLPLYGDQPPPMAEGFSVGRALDALVHPSSDLSERDRQAIRDGMRALLHLGEQAMIAHAARRDVRYEQPVDVPVLDVEKERDHAR